MYKTASRWLSSTVGGNFYERLGVSQSATSADIKKAFFTLSKKYHPDVTGSNDAATKKFVALKEAYDTLKDDVKRRDYDSMLGGGYGYNRGNPFSHQQYGGPFPGGNPGQWQRWSNVRRDPSNGRQYTEEDFERIWREFQRKTQDPRHWQYDQTFREQRQRTWDEFSRKRDEAWRQRAEEYAKRYPSDNMYVKAFNVNWSKINKFLLVYTGVFFFVALIQTWMASDERQYRKPHKNAYNDSNMVPPPSAPLRQYVDGPPPPAPPPGHTADRPFGYPDNAPRG
uniref:J domain-containing protein n=1 Tax=Panagrellus redivivus TaxID=6233 RepID=A0A7E4UU35_PANRE